MAEDRVLPVVDISRLDSDRFEDRLAVAQDLDRACAECGFLYITGAQLDQELFRRVLARAKAYFALDHDIKMNSYIGLSQNHSGYVPVGEEQFEGGASDLKEAYDVNYDYAPLAGRRPLLGPNLWPEMAGFRGDVQAYYRHISGIGRQLFGAFALALALDEHFFAAHLQHPPSQLRMIHYPFDAAAQDREGIGAHTDYECFTLLRATAPGLQIVDKQGRWTDVPLIEGAIVMNLGDMMEILSNGRYLATRHRVKRVVEERYSFAYFQSCDYDYVVAPVVGEGLSRYAPLQGGEHLFDQTARTFAYLKRRMARENRTLAGTTAPTFGPREACAQPPGDRE